jgi:hypothetical protein
MQRGAQSRPTADVGKHRPRHRLPEVVRRLRSRVAPAGSCGRARGTPTVKRLLVTVATVVTLVTLVGAPMRAGAQCGARVSQCRQCHETEAARPVLEGGSPWHRDHAFGDFCPQCHGGDPEARDDAHAHAGLMSPMADVSATCGQCHDPGSVEHAYSSPAPGAPGPSGRRPPGAGGPRSQTSAPVSVPARNYVLAAVALLLGAGGAAYVVRNERRLRALQGQTP